MNEARKNSMVLLLLAAGVLCVADGWAGWQWASCQQELAMFRQENSDSEALGRQIDGLRQAPVKVEESARTGDALAKLVEMAAQEAGLPTDRIVHVAPAEPRRIGDSPYLEQTTAVELRAVTLRQLAEFSVSLSKKESRTSIPNVALRMPPGDANSNPGREFWNVQLTLTAHVFAPKMPAPH
jgi:hypothetical protein